MGTTTKWAIDPTHSEIGFKVKHLVISTVSGNFNKFEGSLTSANEDFSDAEIEFSADVDSINTNQADRDGHLKSPDFFDAGNHPKISFKSKSFKKTSGNDFVLNGDLTIRGTSKNVSLAAEFGGVTKDPWGNTKAGFEISGKINRKDYGVGGSSISLSNTVKINLNVIANLQ